MKTLQHLGREAIEEFKAAYKAEFGILLTDKQVQEKAVLLLRFFGIVTNTKCKGRGKR